MSCSNGLSQVASTLLTAAWVCAQLPQIYNNYRRQLTLGLSAGFLALWFLGDVLSLTLCVFNLATLRFQLWLAAYFVANDVCLAWQYWYYGNRPGPGVYAVARSPRNSSLSTDTLRSAVVASVVASAARVGAMPLANANTSVESHSDTIGVTLAWMCTVVYMLLRAPQLYHNWRRKSVEGLSPVLFTAALLGNVFYTVSILTDCQFRQPGPRRWQFFVKELPYMLGSSGTVVFDAGYFYQRWIYRKVDDAVIMDDL